MLTQREARQVYEDHKALRCVGAQKETRVSTLLAQLDGLTSEPCLSKEKAAQMDAIAVEVMALAADEAVPAPVDGEPALVDPIDTEEDAT